MQKQWPKDENILSWDPEHMENYWELCRQYDQYPQISINEKESLSQASFSSTASSTSQ
ncbi:hypothetical protein [Aliikangiella sp. IMCC44632]